MLQTQEDSKAQIAFQDEIKGQDQILQFANIRCDGCGLSVTYEKQLGGLDYDYHNQIS